LKMYFYYINISILNQEGEVYLMEQCGTKKERELVKRLFKIVIDAEFIIKAALDPKIKKKIIKKIKGSLNFEGSTAYEYPMRWITYVKQRYMKNLF